MRLLLIDGDDVHRARLRRQFAREQAARFELVEAASAAEVRLARSAAPDCALVSTRAPSRDVAAAVDALRDDAGGPGVPVVALTLDADRALGDEALRAGAQDHVWAGSVGPEGLARVIRAAVERRRLELALRESEARRRVVERDAHALREAEGSLLAAEQRKDEFLAMLAHELRGPLAPIRSAVAVLRRLDAQPSARCRCEDVIERHVEHLARLVDDLMDLSRVSRGKLTLRRALVDLRDVARLAVEACQAQVDAREHRLSVSIPEDPLLVEGDPTRLAQVVANLLANAAKYTEDGGHIALSVGRASGGGARISVRDNGHGLDDETRERIFAPFFQAPRSRARADGGLGIGLALVRSLVEMHGGTVTAHSEGLGEGSEFVVRLPCLPADRPSHPALVARDAH